MNFHKITLICTDKMKERRKGEKGKSRKGACQNMIIKEKTIK
jgi:hypothetical protein